MGAAIKYLIEICSGCIQLFIHQADTEQSNKIFLENIVVLRNRIPSASFASSPLLCAEWELLKAY